MKNRNMTDEQYSTAAIENYRLLAEKLSGIPVEMAPRIDRELALIVTGMEMQMDVAAGGVPHMQAAPTG